MDLREDRQSRERPRRRSLARWGVATIAAAGLIAVGAAGAVWVLRHSNGALPVSAPAEPASAPVEPPAAAAPAAPVEVTLALDAVARAGIRTAKAETVESEATVRIPGSVMAHGYREVKVTSLVGGIVTRVHAGLGSAVKRGTPLAILFSAELADAQTKYLSMAAMLEADHKKLERTRKLVEIGAASRQELEEVTAIHDSHATEVEAARQRLLLLGLTSEQAAALRSPSRLVSEVVVPAPIDGVVTGRSANLGQVVGMGMELFVITDLSEVWVVGDLYEQDFQIVRVGTEAAITTPAYPGLTLRGRVSYIDPRVDPLTRTAKVRVEVPNPDGRLRLGMYVTLLLRSRGGHRAVAVPRSAVQALGDGHVVFVPAKEEPGKFVQRVVRLGPPVGDAYTVLAGLEPGEEVVTEGSFFLRAEALRSSP